MARVSIHPDLLLSILYGSPDGRRFTQDTPVLPDVWEAFARAPDAPVSGLIVPRLSHQAHHVADEIYKRLRDLRHEITGSEKIDKRWEVADMPGLISLRCHFDEVVNVVLPMTRWWDSDGMDWLLQETEATIKTWTETAFAKLQAWTQQRPKRRGFVSGTEREIGHLGDFFQVTNPATGKRQSLPDSTARLVLALAAMAAAQGMTPPKDAKPEAPDEPIFLDRLDQFNAARVGRALTDLLRMRFLRRRAQPLTQHYQTEAALQGEDVDPSAVLHLVFTLNLNRRSSAAVFDSVKTAKADAARRLFNLSNSQITWAVVDSGIDARHAAFQDFAVLPHDPKADDPPVLTKAQSRVKQRYNVSLISHLRNRDTLGTAIRRKALARAIAQNIDLPAHLDQEARRAQVETLLDELNAEIEKGRQIDWDMAERLMRMRHDHVPENHHGTHVAGTIGGAWHETRRGKPVRVEGMCPDIKLLDFNVLGGSIEATEFAVVAALRLIRHMNERNDFMVIHGANLSLSIPHDVSNYACGRTPVCEEAETLVSSGVVVVAAAGNAGYNVFRTKTGDVPLHTESSITDPGNAEAVITVGSTHRSEPHTYGVSYFSSRGPTGDGRMKPDLVAPGEKITGPICNNDFARLEGTSMAAPHVSGAAAMLMARFPELIGRPERIKQILCDTATDLGRERAYQGAGLVDILRALQSV